jgi:hypothetical protein
MSSLDFALAPWAALSCIAVYLLLLWKFPSGVVFIGFTSYGIAWTTIAGLNYARCVFLLQLFSALVFFFYILRSKGTERILQFLTSRHSILLWFLVVIWLKISADILYTGLDDFRTDALKAAIQTIFLPTIIFFMAAVGIDPWRFALGIMVGMVAFAIAFVLPTLPGMIAEGRLASALFGEDRLTIYNMDTINGGRFFFMGAVGSMTLVIGGGFRRFWSVLLMVICCVFVAMLLLNGTRQYILGTVIAALMCTYSFIRSGGLLKYFFLAIMIAAIGYLSYNIFQTAAVGERFSSANLVAEVSFSRGNIWRSAFHAGLDNPLFGVGFRKFGEVVTLGGQINEAEAMTTLSGAHGFFQEIWAEHGVVLGVIGLLIFGYSIWQMLKQVQVERHSVIWAHYSALVGMVIPLFISGGVYSASAMYLLAGGMYIAFAKHKIDFAQQHIIRIEEARRAAEEKKKMDILRGRA